MGGKLTLAQTRVLLILGAVLLIALTYFLVFQRNMDQASDFDTKTAGENKRIAELNALQVKVTDLEIFTSLYVDEIDEFIQSFPVKLTQQKSVYLLYRMMINSGVEVQSVTPGNQVPFYYKGQVLSADGDQDQAQKDSEQEEPMSEITVVDMDQMIGSTVSYTVNLSGTTAQIYKALDWIRESTEKLSVGSVNLQFDSSTGKLTGSIVVNFYCMLGNGVPYKEPDMTGMTYGVENIFGEFK